MPRAVRARTPRLQSDALLVRRVLFGEADLMVTLFTEQRGLISAVARSARRSWKRFASLEPMHLLRVSLEERPNAEVMQLVEAALVRARSKLVTDLPKLEAAGRALRWVRRAAPPQTPEPAVWHEINALLDRLDQAGSAHEPAAGVGNGSDTQSDGSAAAVALSPFSGEPRSTGVSPDAHLAATGLRLLAAVGWGLDLERCVRCGRPCTQGSPACIDPAAGGLVCRACGGSTQILRAERRARMLAAMAGRDEALQAEDAAEVLGLVDTTLAAHSGQG